MVSALFENLHVQEHSAKRHFAPWVTGNKSPVGLVSPGGVLGRSETGNRVSMKPAVFRYVRPSNLEEAMSALCEHGSEAKILAGGQSLMPLLNFRMLRPSALIDINRLPGLE